MQKTAENNQMKTRKKILVMVQFAIMLGITAIVCFTPLGSIPIGPVVATIAMVPVIITALLMGTLAGSLMGFFAGLFSFIVWTFTPPNPMIAFLFTPFYSLGEISGGFASILICFVPRILIGTVTGLIFKAFNKFASKNKASETVLYAICGIAGSLANTVLVLAGWYIFFSKEIAQAFAIEISTVFNFAILSTFTTNGIPEAIVSAVIAAGVCLPVRHVLKKQNLL